MAIPILGLDIGGANLKAAHTSGVARTVPFALWKHPQGLAAELARLRAAMPAHELLAITMTGELCDCFPTRRAGVAAILQSAVAAAGHTPMQVWSTRGRFVSAAEAGADPLSVAAGNWLALAHWVARRFADERVLLIDTGSTTTDIVYLNRGVPEPRCLSDAERLLSGELVYTGVRRTPICAVLGTQCAVAAEFFATMLDAYVFVGLLPENPDDSDTADGRPMTRPCAHARLARMRCADVETFTEAHAHLLADEALRTQWLVVLQACGRVLSDKPEVQRVVVSGSGEIVGRNAARRLDRTLTSLADLLGRACSEAACAFAVAALAEREQQDA
jgi:(4-(4-[2-(gamma-L-glutamylamino)ethyl]phenoxymethyl)furan-2-yl)methanamine synthase